MNSIRRILITRPEGSFLKIENWCLEKNIDLICQPFIKTKSRERQNIPQTDWIFFSSPNCVKHFFEQYETGNKRIAAYSTGTANALLEYSVQPSFVGDDAVGPVAIGKSFHGRLKETEKVLFPISQRSKKTIIQELRPEQVVPIIIYDTVIATSKPIESSIDIALFTSPSNFEGYLKSNEYNSEEVWVAFGDTTWKAIYEEHPNRKIYTLNKTSEEAFISFLEDYLSV